MERILRVGRTGGALRDSQVFQFIGEDNVYFYGPAEMALFMGMQGPEFPPKPTAGQLQFPDLIVNRHLLFLNSKASSSGKIKPPMADELLEHYSPAQLRSHFISLGLEVTKTLFQPKNLQSKGPRNAPDPVEKGRQTADKHLQPSHLEGCGDLAQRP